MRYWLLAAMEVVAIGLPLVVQAGGGVLVENMWVRATPGLSPNGAAFVTLTDTSGLGDLLVAAESPVAATIELHIYRLVDDVMQMRAVTSVPIPAGGSVSLRPGAEHMMLVGLKQPLQEGETIPISLTFASSGTVKTMAPVCGIGTMSPRDKDLSTGHTDTPHDVGPDRGHDGRIR